MYRVTDVLSDDIRRKGARYQQMYMPNNWNYSLHLVLGRNRVQMFKMIKEKE